MDPDIIHFPAHSAGMDRALARAEATGHITQEQRAACFAESNPRQWPHSAQCPRHNAPASTRLIDAMEASSQASTRNNTATSIAFENATPNWAAKSAPGDSPEMPIRVCDLCSGAGGLWWLQLPKERGTQYRQAQHVAAS